MKRFWMAAAVSFQLALLLWLSVGSGLATGECASNHTVRAGETLTGIAKHYGATVSALVEMNGLANPNRIRTGQVLCVAPPPLPGEEADPLPPEQSPGAGEMRGQTPDASAQRGLNLVAEFRLTDATPASEPANRWLLMRSQPLGLRYTFPLAPAEAADLPVSIFQTTRALGDASADGVPALWLIANAPNLRERVSPSYTLALIGDPTPLLGLQFGLTPTQTITELLSISESEDEGIGAAGCKIDTKPLSVLGRSAGAEVAMRVELSAGRGSYIGYTVTNLLYWPSPENLAPCGDNVVLALQRPTGDEGYQLLLALPRATGGPTVGESTDADCKDWKGVGGLFEILRVIWRCPD